MECQRFVQEQAWSRALHQNEPSRSYFNIPGYDIINALHPGNRIRGGASIIVKRGIEYEELESIQME